MCAYAGKFLRLRSALHILLFWSHLENFDLRGANKSEAKNECINRCVVNGLSIAKRTCKAHTFLAYVRLAVPTHMARQRQPTTVVQGWLKLKTKTPTYWTNGTTIKMKAAYQTKLIARCWSIMRDSESRGSTLAEEMTGYRSYSLYNSVEGKHVSTKTHMVRDG